MLVGRSRKKSMQLILQSSTDNVPNTSYHCLSTDLPGYLITCLLTLSSIFRTSTDKPHHLPTHPSDRIPTYLPDCLCFGLFVCLSTSHMFAVLPPACPFAYPPAEVVWVPNDVRPTRLPTYLYTLRMVCSLTNRVAESVVSSFQNGTMCGCQKS